MASSFKKTLNSIRTVFNGKTVLDKGVLLGQKADNSWVTRLKRTSFIPPNPDRRLIIRILCYIFYPPDIIAPVATKHEFHVTTKQNYPQAESLPLPINIDPTESTRFSPQRARDITSTAIATNIWNRIDITMDASVAAPSSLPDPHIGSYDCTGAVSLSSSMQSNVPSPFSGSQSFTHLSMPGGQWEQGSKWMSHDLQSSHYTILRREARKNWSTNSESTTKVKSTNTQGTLLATCGLMHGRRPSTLLLAIVRRYHMNVRHDTFCMSSMLALNANQIMRTQCYSKSNRSEASSDDAGGVSQTNQSPVAGNQESTDSPITTAPAPVGRREQLKKTIKEYGATVLVFHIGISLVSLGFFYQLVAR